MSSSYNCDICNRNFSSSRGLKVHILSHKKQEESINHLNCNFCNKTFSNTKILKIHLTRCKQKKEYEIQHTKQNLEKETKELEKLQSQASLLEKENKENYKENSKLKEKLEKLSKENHEEKSKLKEELENLTRELQRTKTQLLLQEQENKDTSKKIMTLYFTQQKQNTNNHSVNNNIKSNINNVQNNIYINNIIPATTENIQKVLEKVKLIQEGITTENDMAKVLLRCGAGDFFQVTDASRGNMVWKETESSEPQKDHNAEHLTKKLCDPVMFKDVVDIIESQIDVNDDEVDNFILNSKQINLYKRIGIHEPQTIMKIGKNLVKNRGTSEQPSIKDPKTNIIKDDKYFYPERLQSLQKILKQTIKEEPMNLLFSDFGHLGGWIGHIIEDYVDAIDYTENNKYIYVLDDKGKRCRLQIEDIIMLLKLITAGELILINTLGPLLIEALKHITSKPKYYQQFVIKGIEPIENLNTNLNILLDLDHTEESLCISFFSSFELRLHHKTLQSQTIHTFIKTEIKKEEKIPEIMVQKKEINKVSNEIIKAPVKIIPFNIFDIEEKEMNEEEQIKESRRKRQERYHKLKEYNCFSNLYDEDSSDN